MTEIWLPLLGGFLLLVAGGELLVRGAVGVATRLGVSPLVIGLTLVGFGTSTPELVTSVQAALAGSPGIAYGNVVGSNIANALLILGVAALLSPIAVTAASLKRDGVVMVGVAVAFAALAPFVPLGRLIGAAFVAALALYIFVAFRQERAAAAGAAPVIDPETVAGPVPSLWAGLGLALGGLVLVVVGGRFLVDGAIALARAWEISETVIGLTVVAVGTSLPELVTSVIAAFRRQGDIAFGNIVGSNIYNILGIAGATALIAPGPVPTAIAGFDAPLMAGVCLLLLLVAWTGLRVARWEGGLLLAGYAAYVWWIWP
jgi:cation:H+ antiporter